MSRIDGSAGSTESIVRPPKQKRSQKTLQSLAGAALELMEEGGLENATIGAIVERAGSSVGSFYARFQGKNDLIRYLREEVWSRAMDRWDEALAARDWKELDLEAVIEGVVGLLLPAFREDYQQRRVLGRELRIDDEGAKKVFDFHQHILATVTPLLLVHRGEMSHPDPEWAIRLGYRFAVGGIREILEMEEVAGILDGGASSDDIVPELARAWKAYLGVGAGEEGDGGGESVDFFDPWR